MWWWMAVALAGASYERSGIEYAGLEGDSSWSTADKRKERKALRKRLDEQQVQLMWQRADGSERPLDPRDDTLWIGVVLAVHDTLDRLEPGAERDMVIAPAGQGAQLATVWFDPGVLTVRQYTHAEPFLVAPRPVADVARDAGLVFDGEVWPASVTRAVDAAVVLLSADELGWVEGLTLRYVEADLPDDAPRLAARGAGGSRWLELYDDLGSPGPWFSGTPEAPHHASTFLALGGLGLALDGAVQAQQQDRVTAAREGLKAVERFVEQAEAAGSVSPADLAKLQADRRELIAQIEREQAVLDGIALPSASLPPGPLPTVKEEADAPQRFAAAFALHHTDPVALQRLAPEVAAWMAASTHLTLLAASAEAVSESPASP